MESSCGMGFGVGGLGVSFDVLVFFGHNKISFESFGGWPPVDIIITRSKLFILVY